MNIYSFVISLQIDELEISESHLNCDISDYLWYFLLLVPKLTQLTIKKSSLLLPESTMSLPHIRTLIARNLPSATCASIIGKLSNLTHLEIHLQHVNDDISEIFDGLKSTGQQLIALSLSCERFGSNRTLSEDCAKRLTKLIERTTTKLEELYLYNLCMTENSQVSLLESTRKVATMQELTYDIAICNIHTPWALIGRGTGGPSPPPPPHKFSMGK